jgi:hypothetical protein
MNEQPIAVLTSMHTESKAVENREAREADRLESQMNKLNVKRAVIQKNSKGEISKDDKDVKIDKLKQVNLKLRQRLKELNVQLEKTIEKANSRKVQKSLQASSQAQTLETVTEHQIRVKEKELKNAQAQLDLYKRELHQLQSKVDDLSGVDRLM